MLESLMAVGIVGVIGVMTIVTLNPDLTLTNTSDATRGYQSEQLSNALQQLQTNRFRLFDIPRYPTADGTGSAIPICRAGMTRDFGCINIDALVGSGFIASIPHDHI